MNNDPGRMYPFFMLGEGDALQKIARAVELFTAKTGLTPTEIQINAKHFADLPVDVHLTAGNVQVVLCERNLPEKTVFVLHPETRSNQIRMNM